MRVNEREARALARWAAAKRVRVEELGEGDRFVDAAGLAWAYLGGLRAQLLKAGTPMPGVVTTFRGIQEVIRMRPRR
jgi:hypothetical protein